MPFSSGVPSSTIMTDTGTTDRGRPLTYLTAPSGTSLKGSIIWV